MIRRILFDLIFYALGASKAQLDHYWDHINPETKENKDRNIKQQDGDS